MGSSHYGSQIGNFIKRYFCDKRLAIKVKDESLWAKIDSPWIIIVICKICELRYDMFNYQV